MKCESKITKKFRGDHSGFDPNESNDAGLDTDGDGASNLEEYLAGTNPNISSIIYTVIVNTSTGGSISPPTQTVSPNGIAIVTISPDTDYDTNFVNGCSGSLSGSTYTTGTITEDCTINVDFSYKYTSTGWGHSCFKDNAGKVKCWGR